MSSHIIGIFDSGVGGFSVLKEVKKNTNADIIYYGDCLNAPYGNRSKEEIVFLIKNIISHLKSQGVTHFVSACNSMSVHTTEDLIKEAGIEKENYLDMVTVIKKFLSIDKDSSILIVGTNATIDSGVYQNLLSDKIKNINTFIPKDLAQAVEEDNREIIRNNIKDILNHANKVKTTHVLYACTHYPLVHDEFEKYKNEIDWKGDFIDPAMYVSQAVKDWDLSGGGSILFQTSKETDVFKKHSSYIYD